MKRTIILLAWAGFTNAQTLFVDGFERRCGQLSFVDSFSQADSAPWPAPWTSVGGVTTADIQGGRGRLRPVPSSYTLARMWAAIPTRDVEARFRFSMEQPATQGVALLVRHNGGYLAQTVPTGQGYGVFIEGGLRGLPGIGIWKQENGVESPLAHSVPALPGPSANISYRVRFRAHQLNPNSTLMQAKYWPESIAEPEGWQVVFTDSTPALQNLSGGVGIDSASSILSPNPVTAHTFVDDIEIEPLCNPMLGRGPAQLVAETFQFTEGPLWRGTHLLFTDIPANTIYRLDPPNAISVFRQPSDQANGLALDAGANLLSAEHGARRVAITHTLTGVRTTLVDRYLGLRFNSPNDLDMRADGMLYFTDPTYGLSDLGLRELNFNGLFRRQPDGTLSAVWEGVVGSNQPNGVNLSPAGDLLFVTDTQQGSLRRYNVGLDGALSNLRILATGLNTPDGMCIDRDSNVYVTVTSGVEVFSPNGARWGLLPIPRAASNCAFGDSDGRSIYVTARQGLYRVR